MSYDYDFVDCGQAERARENDYFDQMDREEAEWFRNRSLRPSVLLNRLQHFISWKCFWLPIGRMRGWW